MMKFFAAILMMMVSNSVLLSQENSGASLGSGFSIMPSLNYVSSATIQLHPNSLNIVERSQTEELTGGYGYGITIRKTFFQEDLSFGFTTEYLKITDSELTQTFENDSIRVRARVTEELWMTPIEFSGYFNIPNFSEEMKIYLGGGVGIYFGDRKRSIHNIESKTISKEAGFSFVILSGMEYYFSQRISGVFEMRFRQGEYRVSSQYPVSSISINGTIFPLDKNLNSRVFVDGLKLSFGVSYNF